MFAAYISPLLLILLSNFTCGLYKIDMPNGHSITAIVFVVDYFSLCHD
jgi:hypothetical protein